jgi:hypothetical protein
MIGRHRLASLCGMALAALLGVFLGSSTRAEAGVAKDRPCSSLSPAMACCTARATAACCCTTESAAAYPSGADALARGLETPSPATERGSRGTACECDSDPADPLGSARRRRAADSRPALEPARDEAAPARSLRHVPESPAPVGWRRPPRWPLYLRVSHLLI